MSSSLRTLHFLYTVYKGFTDHVFQLLGFMIVGSMLLFTVQALGELAVLYPVNGAFYTYAVRFIDPAW